jgi:hypothetical protein
MKHSDRMTQVLYVSGVPLWIDGSITNTLSDKGITGAELAQRLEQARAWRARLDECIAGMAAILDDGETVDERRARIEAEDADPKTAAQALGWFAIEDFAALCDGGPTGFRKHISACRGQIVRPSSEASRKHLIGTGWPEYPGSSFYWADHFQHAETWTEALAKARKDAKK